MYTVGPTIKLYIIEVREVSTVLIPSIGFLSFGGMSNKLSSVVTTDKIVSKLFLVHCDFFLVLYSLL